MWFFERDDQSLHLETRYDNDTGEFVAIVYWPDGTEKTERFTELAAYRTRLIALERQLEDERWARKGGPVILPDGWPDRRLT